MLEDLAPPALLAPRLFASLFPDLEPGLEKIISAWRTDREAEKVTERSVAAPRISSPPVEGPATIYVTSELFGITVPSQTHLDTPAGLYLDVVITYWTFEFSLLMSITDLFILGEPGLLIPRKPCLDGQSFQVFCDRIQRGCVNALVIPRECCFRLHITTIQPVAALIEREFFTIKPVFPVDMNFARAVK